MTSLQINAVRAALLMGAGLFIVRVAMARTLGEVLLAAGIAAIVAMLAAGLFEYNFGDSEFLMLFLGLITLPFAASLDGSDPDGSAAVPVTRPATPLVSAAHAE